MWAIAVLFIAVLVIAPLVTAASRPPADPACVDSELSPVGHERAREEMQVITDVTKQLMRAVAVAPPSAQAPVARAEGPNPGAASATRVVAGFAWSPQPLASNSTTGDRVTFYMPLNRAGY